MTNKEPKVDLTGRYELREASAVLEIDKSTLLRWTKLGVVKAGVKRSNGRKFWTGAELVRIWKSTY